MALITENIQLEIQEKVKQLLQIDDEIPEDADLTAIGLDSMRSVGLIVELEEHFEIVFDDDELLVDNFSTINKIMSRVISKVA